MTGARYSFGEAVAASRRTGCEFWRDNSRFRAFRYRVFPAVEDLGLPERLMVRKEGGALEGFHAETHLHWWHASAADWVTSEDR